MLSTLTMLLLTVAPDTLAELRVKADKGDPQAQFEMGLRYHKGDGVEKDDKTALEWHKKATLKGHTKAEVQIGYLIAHGLGAKQDFAEAANWYRKAAWKGDTTAQHNMGLQTLQGQGLKKDPVQAADWFRLAAMQGHARAQFDLGKVHEEGIGTEKNPEGALLFYELAAAHPEQERIFGKEKAAELLRRRDGLRKKVGEEERKAVTLQTTVFKALFDVHPRKYGTPGGVGTIRGWYIWESYDPKTGRAVVVHEGKGNRYSVYALAWATTYRRLAYGASPEDLLPGERVNLFFASSGFHNRGLLVHYQDEIGQMKGHGHIWEVVSTDEKVGTMSARVMVGEKPLDNDTYQFEIDKDCKRWKKGKLDAAYRPVKGDRLYLTWVKQADHRIVMLMSDDASLDAIKSEELARLDRRIAKEGMTCHIEIVEERRVGVMMFATWWQQAAKLKEGQAVRLVYGEEQVTGQIVWRKNRGTYGSGPMDMQVFLKEEKDADKVRSWRPWERKVSLIPE